MWFIIYVRINNTFYRAKEQQFSPPPISCPMYAGEMRVNNVKIVKV